MTAAALNTASWGRFTIVQKLIVVNVIVFLFINILDAVLGLFMQSIRHYFDVTHWLAVPSGLPNLLTRPWTLLTYMFLHEDLLHILFNMLWLFWMGSIFLEYLGAKKLFSTYVLGGLSGALLYIVSYNTFPLFSNLGSIPMLGASASVLAITVGIATLLPDYTIRLLFFGNVPLKYLAAGTLALDLLSISSGSNPGGHIAHLGGALFGFFYIRSLRQGRDWAAGFNKLVDKIVSVFNSSPGRERPLHTRSRPASDE